MLYIHLCNFAHHYIYQLIYIYQFLGVPMQSPDPKIRGMPAVSKEAQQPQSKASTFCAEAAPGWILEMSC